MTNETPSIYTREEQALIRRLSASRSTADRLAIAGLIASALCLVVAVAMLCAGRVWPSAVPMFLSLGFSYAASVAHKRAQALSAEVVGWLKAASAPERIYPLKNARKRNPRQQKEL